MNADLDWAGWWSLAHPPEPAALPPSLPREKCTGHSSKTGERCKRWPLKGSTVCTSHGAAAPQVREKAAQRYQEQQAAALARKQVGDLDLTQFSNPLDALEFSISYGYALASRLAKLVEQIPDTELRYQGRISEQIRGEVTAAQTALRDLRTSAAEAGKLGLAERRIGIQQATIGLLDKALSATLQKAGLDFGQVDQARQVFREELSKITIQGKVEHDGDSLRSRRRASRVLAR